MDICPQLEVNPNGHSFEHHPNRQYGYTLWAWRIVPAGPSDRLPYRGEGLYPRPRSCDPEAFSAPATMRPKIINRAGVRGDTRIALYLIWDSHFSVKTTGHQRELPGSQRKKHRLDRNRLPAKSTEPIQNTAETAPLGRPFVLCEAGENLKVFVRLNLRDNGPNISEIFSGCASSDVVVFIRSFVESRLRNPAAHDEFDRCIRVIKNLQ